MNDIGKRIKERRLHLKLSAEELAPMVGLSAATIYRYENGEIKKVNTNKLSPFAKALNTSEAYLMGWVDSPNVEVEAENADTKYLDTLYISRPSGDMQVDELRKYLHEVIDSLSDKDLYFFRDLTLRMKE